MYYTHLIAYKNICMGNKIATSYMYYTTVGFNSGVVAVDYIFMCHKLCVKLFSVESLTDYVQLSTLVHE